MNEAIAARELADARDTLNIWNLPEKVYRFGFGYRGARDKRAINAKERI